MSKIAYVVKRFGRRHRAVIDAANRLLEGYSRDGYTITLRTLYYRFVALDLFPDDRKWVSVGGRWRRSARGTKNAEPNYKWLGKLVSDGRLAGLIDWEFMEDRMRSLADLQHFAGADDLLKRAAGWYHVDMWAGQRWRPEVWVEKDAVGGLVSGVCQENDVPFFCCRGYTSLSEMWRASLRLRRHLDAGQRPWVIHFGDHDPSGIDMSRDILDRLTKTFMADCEFVRVALNMIQIEEMQPPPNPVKTTDSRHRGYIARFGEESWELDALEPAEFRTIIEGQLAGLRDQRRWDADAKEKARVKRQLAEVAADWQHVPGYKRELVRLRREGGLLAERLAEVRQELTAAGTAAAAERDRLNATIRSLRNGKKSKPG